MYRYLKRLLIGQPLKTAEESGQSLTKFKALALLSSDALSSVAYGQSRSQQHYLFYRLLRPGMHYQLLGSCSLLLFADHDVISSDHQCLSFWGRCFHVDCDQKLGDERRLSCWWITFSWLYVDCGCSHYIWDRSYYLSDPKFTSTQRFYLGRDRLIYYDVEFTWDAWIGFIFDDPSVLFCDHDRFDGRFGFV